MEREIVKDFLSGKELLERLKKSGVNFVTGVPCGELRDLLNAVAEDYEIKHYPTTNERQAAALASGAWLGGKNPLLYMQNSGFFVSSNEIGSIMITCNIPGVFVISWRGSEGEDATQHLATGKATIPLLKAMGIEFVIEPTPDNIDYLLEKMENTQMPVAILKKRHSFNTPQIPIVVEVNDCREKGELFLEDEEQITLSREEVLSQILINLDASVAVFSSTGLISRSVFTNFDGPNHFYNAGGFGETSSLALGFIMSRQDVSTLIIEGDGSVLADLGNINLIGHYSPKKLKHIVLDNNALCSCSGEQTIGSKQIPILASQLGYKRVFSVASLSALIDSYNIIMSQNDGPQMIHVKINTLGRRDFNRPLAMGSIARRFKSHFTI